MDSEQVVREGSTQWNKKHFFPFYRILYFKNGKFVMYGKIYVIIKKIFIEIMNKKIRVLNHSQSFREQPIKILVPYYKHFLRKGALYKHYFNIGKIELSGTL